MYKWLTNSPEAAKALQQADAAYQQERNNAAHLPLAQKVVSYRCAKRRLDQAHERIAAEYGKHPADSLGEVFTIEEFNQSIRQ